MSSSARARRMARNHRRLRQHPRLNLVALMDIFTILVLFLMVNNGDVEVLQADRDIELPESVSELRPEAALTIRVSEADISVGGTPVGLVADALAAPQRTLEPLAAELARLAALAPELGEAQRERGRPIVIMATRAMPYELLKRIMATCAASDFRDVTLAVNSVPADPTSTVGSIPGSAPGTALPGDAMAAALPPGGRGL
ncbi:MAG: biopolymer transporter ExbD [Pseudomonadales bacterium]|nr:biopolymer transporter ExbD [Pseudomonadales bacterium]